MPDKTNVYVDGEILETNDGVGTKDNVPLREAEITGKINELLRLMMDNDVQSIDSEDFADKAVFLVQCYQEGYRHSYYSISAEIYSHWNDSGRKEEKLNNLAANVDMLKYIILNNFPKIDLLVIKGITKFYDHIMLENIRLVDQQRSFDELNKIIHDFDSESKKSYNKQEMSLSQTVAEFENRFGEAEKIIENLKEVTNQAADSIHKAEKDIESVKKDTDKMQNDIGKTRKKVKGIYSQFVSILGIFTAIVIVFFGGASIFSDVLTNIHEAEWYQIGFSVALVGLVLFDIIFMFLYILSKFLEVPIHTKGTAKSRFFLFRWIEKYPYVFLFHLFCIVVMIVCA